MPATLLPDRHVMSAYHADKKLLITSSMTFVLRELRKRSHLCRFCYGVWLKPTSLRGLGSASRGHASAHGLSLFCSNKLIWRFTLALNNEAAVRSKPAIPSPPLSYARPGHLLFTALAALSLDDSCLAERSNSGSVYWGNPTTLYAHGYTIVHED